MIIGLKSMKIDIGQHYMCNYCPKLEKLNPWPPKPLNIGIGQSFNSSGSTQSPKKTGPQQHYFWQFLLNLTKVMLLWVDSKYLSDFVNMKSELRKFSPCLVQFCNAVLQCRFAVQFWKAKKLVYIWSLFQSTQMFLCSVNCCKIQMGCKYCFSNFPLSGSLQKKGPV